MGNKWGGHVERNIRCVVFFFYTHYHTGRDVYTADNAEVRGMYNMTPGARELSRAMLCAKCRMGHILLYTNQYSQADRGYVFVELVDAVVYPTKSGKNDFRFYTKYALQHARHFHDAAGNCDSYSGGCAMHEHGEQCLTKEWIPDARFRVRWGLSLPIAAAYRERRT